MTKIVYALLSVWLFACGPDEPPKVSTCCEFEGYACASPMGMTQERCEEFLQGAWVLDATCSIETGNCEPINQEVQ